MEDTKSDSGSTEIILQLKRTIKGVGTIEATGKQTSEGFVVLKGTHISPNDDNTIPVILREQRKGTGLDDNGCLMEDILFNSPSYAAMFVFGKSTNGLTSWKTEDGMRLVDYYNDMNDVQKVEFCKEALIPDGVSLELENFEEFYEKRKALLTVKIRQLLG